MDEVWLGQLDIALGVAARLMLKGVDIKDFSEWADSVLPMLLKPHSEDQPAHPLAQAVQDAAFVGLFARVIYAAMPLPARRFRPAKLQLPERNEPCCCGSGHKFKMCCGPMAHNLPHFPPELCAGPMLDAMGKAAWLDLPTQGMPVALVGSVAQSWYEHDRLDDAAKLLEPWLPKDGPIADDRADLLDLLGDLYADIGKPRKRKALAQAMVERGGRQVQSKGWQRLALMHCDADQHAQARHALQQAMRLSPDDPALSILELSLLIGEGATERLRERADFWARSLSRKNQHGDHDGLIATIRDMGERGHDMLADTMVAHTPQLKALSDWLTAQPAPKLALAFGPHATSEDIGPLKPNAELARALKEWALAFDGGEPELVMLGHDDDAAWGNMAAWLALLQRKPVLANSFDVLDALVMLLTTHHVALAGQAVAERLIARALALWSQIRGLYPQAQCAWGFMDNRPALRLIAQYIVRDETADAAQCFEWLRHLVEVLNPNDNHGFRERLMAVYLRRGMLQEALALSDRYPDDSDAMAMLRARTLWALGRQGDATSAMVAVFARHAHFAKVWRSTKMPPDSREPYIQFGSLQEARQAYLAQHDLWQDPALRKTIMAVSKG